MRRTYKCLSQQEFIKGTYKLIPIRDLDKYAIMQWRNEQIDILRQKNPLTEEKQKLYFSNVVDKLFEQDKPDQLLFSFLENNVLVGYGGLVHIDWEDRNAEISFITATERNSDKYQFTNDWKCYLALIKRIAGTYLNFRKIHTYTYDIRPQLFKILIESNFVEEARLKNQISINNKKHDVLIHSYFFNDISFRVANENDVLLYFKWVNDSEVRKNSFNQNAIELEQHKKWFENKLNGSNGLMLIASVNEKEAGQIRFDAINGNSFEIAFSVDKNYRGKGIGSVIIKKGTAELFKTKPLVKRVIGKVKKDNFTSQQSFLNAGFNLIENVDNDSEMYIYYLDK